MRRLILILATGLGVGYSPKAPGTLGTLIGVLLYLALKDLAPLSFGLTVTTFVLFSAWVATEAEREFGEKDSQKIVIDEVAGFLVTMAFVPFSWFAVGTGFVLFRLFDIWKPYPCRWMERHLPGGWGVVGDDLMAGVYANLCLQIATRLLL